MARRGSAFDIMADDFPPKGLPGPAGALVLSACRTDRHAISLLSAGPVRPEYCHRYQPSESGYPAGSAAQIEGRKRIMKCFELQGPDGFDALKLVDRPVPQASAGEVLVRLKAATLNYRDLLTV